MDKRLLCNYQSMSCREEKIKIKNIRQVYKIYISQKDEMYKLFSDKPQPIDECVHKIESSYLILLCIGWVLPLTCTSSLEIYSLRFVGLLVEAGGLSLAFLARRADEPMNANL